MFQLYCLKLKKSETLWRWWVQDWRGISKNL